MIKNDLKQINSSNISQNHTELFMPLLVDVEQRKQTKQNRRGADSYRREKAREVAERFLLADGSNQHSASVQLVSAREDHSSTAARAPNTLPHTGGEEREGDERGKGFRKDRKNHIKGTGKIIVCIKIKDECKNRKAG